MSEKITNIQIQEFLNDFETNSITQILEEGKEKKEVVAIAKVKGINLKGNKDLAGFKTIYTFANKANKNKARLPKATLLKALPSMIGKPVNIDHNRRYVVGHYIDYRYKVKEDMVIAYGVFYKSNFGEEWEEAKKLFKTKKLATSYEIWCPEDKRHYLEDGTYELLEQEIAGGALLYQEEPAFSGAKVLELAKHSLDEQPEELVYAKKYREDELITSKTTQEYTVNLDSNTDVGFETANETNPTTISTIKCSNCQEEFAFSGSSEIKCPKCLAVLDSQGNMKYPPQVKDFKVLCPSCKVNRWLIISKSDDEARLRCGQCSKEYKITFDKKKVNEILDKVDFVYTGSVSCYQCNNKIYISGVSNINNRTVKCKRCGLEFSYDILHEAYKKISNIVEIKEKETVKSSEKGGKETKEFKVEVAKYHRYVDDFGKLEATLPDDYGESKEIEVAKRLTTEQRNALPDSMFAVVVRVKNKRTGKLRKIRMFPINDEAHVRNALARLGQPAPKATLKRLGVSIEAVKKRILRRARQLKMTELLERYKKSSKEIASFNCSCVKCGHKVTSDKHCVNLKCPKCGGQMRRTDRPGDGKPEEKKEAKVEKSLEKQMAKKKEEKKVEVKVEEKVESKVKEQPKAEETPKAEEKPKAEETPKAEEAPKTEEKVEKAEEKKEIPAEEPKAEQPKVEDKKEEVKEEKVEEATKEKVDEKKDEKVEEKPVEKVEEKKEEKSDDKKDEKVDEKASEKTDEKPTEEKVEEAKETREQKYAKGIRRLASKIRDLKKQLELYKANAKEIIKRREELGDFVADLTDEDVLNDDKFARAKTEKENVLLRAQVEKGSENVGSKAKDDEYYVKMRKRIDDEAFKHLKK